MTNPIIITSDLYFFKACRPKVKHSGQVCASNSTRIPLMAMPTRWQDFLKKSWNLRIQTDEIVTAAGAASTMERSKSFDHELHSSSAIS